MVVTAVAFNVSWGDPLAAGRDHRPVRAGGRGLRDAGRGAVAQRGPGRRRWVCSSGLALAALGGCMIPFADHAGRDAVDRTPDPPLLGAARPAVAHPDGGGIESVAPNLAVLAVFAVVLMGLAAWRFRKAISG